MQAPNNLREFRLVNVKAPYSTLHELFEIIESQNHLRKLRLSHIELKSDILLFNRLNLICQNSTSNLVELDFSGLNMVSNQLAEVMRSIEENCILLQSLNLSFNALNPDPKNEHSNKFCETLAKLVADSTTIMHLNLENMCLGNRIRQLMWTFNKSCSLQSIHLSNNDIPLTTQKSLLHAFGITTENNEDLFDWSEPMHINMFK